MSAPARKTRWSFPRASARLGVGPGDYVEIAYEKNRALKKPKKVVDRDEPLGPKTRAALRQALKEVTEGKTGPPLKTQQELQDWIL